MEPSPAPYRDAPQGDNLREYLPLTLTLTLTKGDNLWEYFFEQPGTRGLRLADLGGGGARGGGGTRGGAGGGAGGGSGAVVRSVQARC